MKPDHFELQHADEPQPKLHDGGCAIRDWPMPAGGKWVPKPNLDVPEELRPGSWVEIDPDALYVMVNGVPAWHTIDNAPKRHPHWWGRLLGLKS